MKRLYIFGLAVLSALLLNSKTASGQLKKSVVHGGFLYPISSHGTHAHQYSNLISIHALVGVSGEERGFATSGIALIVKEDAKGFKASGIANIIGGNASGFTASGIVNTYRSAQGFQAAGISNIALDTVKGFQAAGIYNQASYTDGLQVAGLANTSKTANGSQIAGLINAAQDVAGSQLAGLVNIGKNVKGVQVAGLLNLADSSEYPIGLVNLIRNGEQSLGLTTDDNQTTLIGFRSGSKKMYGIVAFGTNFKNDREVFAAQLGLGANLFSTERFRLKSEITHTILESFKRGSFSKYSIGFLPSLRLGKIDLFAGPSIAYVETSSVEGKDLIKNYLWDRTNNQDRLQGLYVGYTGGLHWRL